MIKELETVALGLVIISTIYISHYNSDANFLICYSMFLVSSIILTVTSLLQKQYIHIRLQIFFMCANSYGIIKILN